MTHNNNLMNEIVKKVGAPSTGRAPEGGRGVGKAAAERNKVARPSVAIKTPNAAGPSPRSSVNSPSNQKLPGQDGSGCEGCS